MRQRAGQRLALLGLLALCMAPMLKAAAEDTYDDYSYDDYYYVSAWIGLAGRGCAGKA